MSPTQNQIGGSHYKNAAIQPFEFTMKNGWDSCAHSILKYVHRHQSKGGRQDLEKAIHIVELRQIWRQPTWRERGIYVLNSMLMMMVNTTIGEKDDPRISMEVYCSMNKIEPEETEILMLLETWVRSQRVHQDQYPAIIIDRLKKLISKHYGETA